MMSNITPNTPRSQPDAPSAPMPLAPRRAPGGFWSFLKTLFVGTAGLAVLGVAGALAGSAWLTANQRAEAEKPHPWVDPSFTTTAITTGGMLARWMDNDSNLDNGHTYVKGIYDLWKAKNASTGWSELARNPAMQVALPQLWKLELSQDTAIMATLNEAKAREVASEVREQSAKISQDALNAAINPDAIALTIYELEGWSPDQAVAWLRRHGLAGISDDAQRQILLNARKLAGTGALRSHQIAALFLSSEVRSVVDGLPTKKQEDMHYAMQGLYAKLQELDGQSRSQETESGPAKGHIHQYFSQAVIDEVTSRVLSQPKEETTSDEELKRAVEEGLHRAAAAASRPKSSP